MLAAARQWRSEGGGRGGGKVRGAHGRPHIGANGVS